MIFYRLFYVAFLWEEVWEKGQYRLRFFLGRYTCGFGTWFVEQWVFTVLGLDYIFFRLVIFCRIRVFVLVICVFLFVVFINVCFTYFGKIGVYGFRFSQRGGTQFWLVGSRLFSSMFCRFFRFRSGVILSGFTIMSCRSCGYVRLLAFFSFIFVSRVLQLSISFCGSEVRAVRIIQSVGQRLYSYTIFWFVFNLVSF